MIVTHAENVARRKVKGPPEWQFADVTSVTGGLLFHGSVTTSKKTGKNKGRPKWSMPLDTVIVTDEEYRIEYARYEREEKLCAECFGKREVLKSWDHKTGVTMTPCRRCNGTGNAQDPRP